MPVRDSGSQPAIGHNAGIRPPPTAADVEEPQAKSDTFLNRHNLNFSQLFLVAHDSFGEAESHGEAFQVGRRPLRYRMGGAIMRASFGHFFRYSEHDHVV